MTIKDVEKVIGKEEKIAIVLTNRALREAIIRKRIYISLVDSLRIPLEELYIVNRKMEFVKEYEDLGVKIRLNEDGIII